MALSYRVTRPNFHHGSSFMDFHFEPAVWHWDSVFQPRYYSKCCRKLHLMSLLSCIWYHLDQMAVLEGLVLIMIGLWHPYAELLHETFFFGDICDLTFQHETYTHSQNLVLQKSACMENTKRSFILLPLVFWKAKWKKDAGLQTKTWKDGGMLLVFQYKER